jgi:hypothetical protein
MLSVVAVTAKNKAVAHNAAAAVIGKNEAIAYTTRVQGGMGDCFVPRSDGTRCMDDCFVKSMLFMKLKRHSLPYGCCCPVKIFPYLCRYNF